MTELLARAADLVWSYPVVGLCLFSALFFTLRLGFIQIRAFPHALALISGRYDREDEAGSISHFQALSAALSGTIGIGNIAGVAIAISVGGPGAVLWMWITGLLGMATKFVECTLGTHYREIDPVTKEARGGPMYYIVAALGPRWRPVAFFYALTIAIAGFGFTCMFQSNQAADVLQTHFAIPGWATGAALAILTGAVVIGGIKSIGRWAARIVPLMCLVYVGGALLICMMEFERLPEVARLILTDGLSGDAAAGGALGSVILWGVRRAIFSNEAGLGSASIAHAAVKTDEPIREGVVASLGPFIDTVIVSGATAFVIVLSGSYGPLGAEAVEQLEPTQVSESWRAADAAFDTPRAERFVDGVPTWVTRGATSEGQALVFELPADVFDHDGVRLPARLDAGTLELELRRDDEVLAAISLEAPAPGSGSRWTAQTLEFAPLDPDTREGGAPTQLHVLPSSDVETAWIAAPSLVQTRSGISRSATSFDRYLPGFGSVFITLAGFAFALSTMITWSYYGEVAGVWALGPRAGPIYRGLFVVLAFVGAVRKLDVVISFSDLFVGLLVIPNVIVLLRLSPQVVQWSRDYFRRLRAGEFDPP